MIGPSGKAMIHPPHDHGPGPVNATAPAAEAPLGITQGEQPAAIGSRVTCPVCGDEFTVEAKSPVRHHKGKTLVFCCERCLPHFQKDPDIFLNQ